MIKSMIQQMIFAGVAFFITVFAIVVLSPVFSGLEGRVFPVVSKLEIANVRPHNGIVDFYVHFEKHRQCNKNIKICFENNQSTMKFTKTLFYNK